MDVSKAPLRISCLKRRRLLVTPPICSKPAFLKTSWPTLLRKVQWRHGLAHLREDDEGEPMPSTPVRHMPRAEGRGSSDLHIALINQPLKNLAGKLKPDLQ